MCHANSVLEGLITNLFVMLLDGRVLTAANWIYRGSMREEVLKKCSDLGILVDLTSPSLDQVHEWAHVFLSSATQVR